MFSVFLIVQKNPYPPAIQAFDDIFEYDFGEVFSEVHFTNRATIRFDFHIDPEAVPFVFNHVKVPFLSILYYKFCHVIRF